MTNSRGRKPNPTAQAVPDGVDDRALARINTASQEVSAAAHLAMQQGDLYRIIGRIEAAHFLETVSSRMIGEAYLAARSVIGGLGSIAVRAADGSTRNVSSLEEFCDAAMPVSHRRCQQIAQAMHTLGADLYEQAERLGLGHRNYSALRALPNDMQDEVKAAIASGDRDQVVTLIEELAARNASLKAESEETKKVLSAKDKVIAKKDQKLNALAEADEVRRNGTPNEREQQQVGELRDAGIDAELALRKLLAAVDEVTRSPAT
ncbi:MAG TPA: hypothetical protein PLF63_04840, partial [Rubrivivax sp.]|nr:hypothetical protein [Rubrivivax sp.]